MAKTVSLSRAAEILGVSRNTLGVWLERGCPAVRRADRAHGIDWQLNVPAIHAWRVDCAVKEALAGYADENGSTSKEEADRRRSVAMAIVAEVEADQVLRSVISRADAESCVAAFCQVLKTGLSNAASKIASRATTITQAPAIEEMTQAEMNRAFQAAKAELSRAWNLTPGPTPNADDPLTY